MEWVNEKSEVEKQVCHDKILVGKGKFGLEKADFLTQSIKDQK